MYSWEIRKFLEERDYYIGGDDLIKVTSIYENPQLRYREIRPDDTIYMVDDRGEEFYFKAMPFEEAVRRNLVKSKINEENDINKKL